MRSPATRPKQILLTCPHLPLGVYREVAAHLRQVEGVITYLIMHSTEHQESQKFDYYQSQVAALQIEYEVEISETSSEQVNSILGFYAQRYGAWQDYSEISKN